MTAVSVVGPDGSTAKKTVELPDEIFAAKVNVPLIHQVVVAQQAAARQGTHATKTRGDVRGGGKKPYRQKGTGYARQGSRRAPHYRGGGIIFGPHPRSYHKDLPRKMRRLAMRSVLSARAALTEARGALDTAVDLYREAARLWREFEHVPEEAQAWLGLGRCSAALGRPAEARPALEEGAAILGRLGAQPLLAECERVLAAIGPSS